MPIQQKGFQPADFNLFDQLKSQVSESIDSTVTLKPNSIDDVYMPNNFKHGIYYSDDYNYDQVKCMHNN